VILARDVPENLLRKDHIGGEIYESSNGYQWAGNRSSHVTKTDYFIDILTISRVSVDFLNELYFINFFSFPPWCKYEKSWGKLGSSSHMEML
jgi:hypothetical protein